jgi:SAM-dependent methyltransferase
VSADPWSSVASLYEWEHAEFDLDLATYLGLARRTGGPILEAACGTGRLAIPLAAAGYAVVGVDSSPEMLAVARARLATALPTAERLTLLLADVRGLDVPQRFGLAILALDGLGLFLEVQDQLVMLQTLWRHLRRGGLLALDVANGAELDDSPTEELRHHYTRPHPEHGRPLTKWVARQTDRARQMHALTLLYDEMADAGTLRRTVVQYRLRYFYRFELQLLLERAGFLVEGLYGNYDLGPLEGPSERLIAVARRPDSSD